MASNIIELKTFKAIYPDYATWKLLVWDEVVSFFSPLLPDYINPLKMFYTPEQIYKAIYRRYFTYVQVNEDDVTHALFINGLISTTPDLYLNSLKLQANYLVELTPDNLLKTVIERKNKDPNAAITSVTINSSTPDDDTNLIDATMANARSKSVTASRNAMTRLEIVNDISGQLRKLATVNFTGYLAEWVNKRTFSELWRMFDSENTYVYRGLDGKDGVGGTGGGGPNIVDIGNAGAPSNFQFVVRGFGLTDNERAKLSDYPYTTVKDEFFSFDAADAGKCFRIKNVDGIGRIEFVDCSPFTPVKKTLPSPQQFDPTFTTATWTGTNGTTNYMRMTMTLPFVLTQVDFPSDQIGHLQFNNETDSQPTGVTREYVFFSNNAVGETFMTLDPFRTGYNVRTKLTNQGSTTLLEMFVSNASNTVLGTGDFNRLRNALKLISLNNILASGSGGTVGNVDLGKLAILTTINPADANKVVGVNAAGTAYELKTISTGGASLPNLNAIGTAAAQTTNTYLIRNANNAIVAEITQTELNTILTNGVLASYLSATLASNTYATITTTNTISTTVAAKLDSTAAASTYATQSSLASGLATKLDSTTAASTYATQSAVTSALATKANTSDVYSKANADDKFALQIDLESLIARVDDLETWKDLFVPQRVVTYTTVNPDGTKTELTETEYVLLVTTPAAK